MRKLCNLKAVRRLLTVLTVSAIVISLFCMTGTLPASAAVTPKQSVNNAYVATSVALSNFTNGSAKLVTMSEEDVYTDFNGDGEALKVAFSSTNKGLSGANFTFGGLDVNKQYTVSFYVKTDVTDVSGNVWVNFYDTDGNYVFKEGSTTSKESANADLSRTATYSSWTRITSKAFTPYSENIQIGLYLKNWEASATNAVYIDNVVVTEADFSSTNPNGAVSLSKWVKTVTSGTHQYVSELVAGGVDGDNQMLQLTRNAGAISPSAKITGLDVNKTYTISFWIKKSRKTSNNANLFINGYEQDDANVANSLYDYFVDASEINQWKYVEVSNVKPRQSDGSITVGFWANSANLVLCFDAFKICETAAPEVAGATIAVADESKQDLRFIAKMTGYVPSTATNIEYGVYMVRTDKLAALGGELTEELYQANKGVIIKASETVASVADVPTTIDANLKNAVNLSNRCGIEISMRAYIKYTENVISYSNGVVYTPTDYYIYSTNTSTEGSIVTNGVASRSVYGVAYSIVATELNNGATGLTYDAGTGKYNDGTKDLTDSEVLAFALANIGYLN